MRVILTSHGSTGDIVPMIALGRALLDAGHDTVFVASDLFQGLIEGAGVPFHEAPPSWTTDDGRDAMKQLARVKQPLKQLKRIYEFGLGHYEEYFNVLEKLTKGADLLVSSYLYPCLQPLAERNGAKFAVATFAHNSVPTTENAPLPGLEFPFLPGAMGRLWRDTWWRIADASVRRTLNGVIGDLLKARGYPTGWSFFREPAPLALVTVSQALFGPPRETLDPRFVFAGYFRYQTEPDAAQAAEIDAFCEGELVPVLNFGSVTWDSAVEEFQTLLARWPAGKKLIVQSGWAGFAQTPGHERQDIKIIGQANHDMLFARASVIIHHGGAGTTASALHAGRPQIIIPQIADQHFWARECAGIGLAKIGRGKVWPFQLAEWVAEVESSASYRSNAQKAAEKLRRENGPMRAVEILEDYLAGD
ncbi:glycosyltransferase [Cerasicoccus fimbriatus]|uniref:glycosyltransferase n=1 Tax=Cerasicoccus fimbriatus TaxID=3014554 RepID=UPI0022B3E0AA|nr:glycosyltransferase [Cerasicoccus sp. TK19100]